MKHIIALSLVLALALGQSFMDTKQKQQQESFGSQQETLQWVQNFVRNLTPQQKAQLITQLQGKVQTSETQSIGNIPPEHRRQLLEQLQGENVGEIVRNLSPQDKTALREHFTRRTELPIHLKNRIESLSPQQKETIKTRLTQQQTSDVHSVLKNLTPEQRQRLRDFFLQQERSSEWQSGQSGQSMQSGHMGGDMKKKMREECVEWARVLLKGKMSKKALDRVMSLSEHEAMQVLNYLMAPPNVRESLKSKVNRYIEGLSDEDQKAMGIFILAHMETPDHIEKMVDNMTDEQRIAFINRAGKDSYESAFGSGTRGGTKGGETKDESTEWANKALFFVELMDEIEIPKHIRQRVSGLSDQQRQQLFTYLAGTELNQDAIRNAPDFARNVLQGFTESDIKLLSVFLADHFGERFVSKVWESYGKEQGGQQGMMSQQQPQQPQQHQQQQQQFGGEKKSTQQFEERAEDIMRRADDRARQVLIQAEAEVRRLYDEQMPLNVQPN